MSQWHKVLAVTALYGLSRKMSTWTSRNWLYHYVLKIWIAGLHPHAGVHLNFSKVHKQFAVATIRFQGTPFTSIGT